MIKHKKLTSKAGITLPKDMRHDAGMAPGMAVDMITTDEGILIRKHVPTCNICGSTEKIIAYAGFEICAECAKYLYEEAVNAYGNE